MIKKKRAIPIKLLKLEALLRRLPMNHPRRGDIEDELAISYAGFRGEQTLDYYIEQYLDKRHYFILQDLRLETGNNSHFQIDTLLITQNYFMIFEAKNISGTLLFEKHQLLRTQNEIVEAFPNPIVQAENQKFHLKTLLRKLSISNIPIEAFVVITNPKTIIKMDPHYQAASRQVIRVTELREYIDLMNKKYTQSRFDKKDIRRLARILVKHHHTSDPDILGRFQIVDADIRSGVFCEDCSRLSVVRKNRSWKCHTCGKKSKKAYIQALIDYYLLFGPIITNGLFRKHLGISSVDMASYLLRSLNLPKSGECRHRKYYLSLDKLRERL